MLLVMLCEHSNWQQCVPFFACSICDYNVPLHPVWTGPKAFVPGPQLTLDRIKTHHDCHNRRHEVKESTIATWERESTPKGGFAADHRFLQLPTAVHNCLTHVHWPQIFQFLQLGKSPTVPTINSFWWPQLQLPTTEEKSLTRRLSCTSSSNSIQIRQWTFKDKIFCGILTLNSL